VWYIPIPAIGTHLGVSTELREVEDMYRSRLSMRCNLRDHAAKHTAKDPANLFRPLFDSRNNDGCAGGEREMLAPEVLHFVRPEFESNAIVAANLFGVPSWHHD
jgi:hypothetical protein